MINSEHKEKDLNTNKKRKIDIIKDYLNTQKAKMKKLTDLSKFLHNLINELINYTKIYSGHLTNLGLSIIPEYSVEGEFAQAIQSSILFFAMSFNTFVTDLEEIRNKISESNVQSLLEQFEKDIKLYFDKVRSAIINNENFKKEIELYQEYLVIKSYNKIQKLGLKYNDDEIVNVEEVKQDIVDENEIDKNTLNLVSEYKFNNIDNNEKVTNFKYSYMINLSEANNSFNKIKDFLADGKNSIIKHINNICLSFTESLIKCVDNQKKNFEMEKNVINNINTKLITEIKDDTTLKPSPHKLNYIDIYKELLSNKESLKKENEEKQEEIENKGKKKEIKNKEKQKEIKNKEKLMDIHKQKTTKTKKNENKKVNKKEEMKLITSRTVSFMNTEIDQSLKKLEKNEAYKKMIMKLNRGEIIDIFQNIIKIEDLITEDDFAFIEKEKSFKTINDILNLIFYDTSKYTEKEKNKLIDYFKKNDEFTLYFIKVLNDHRVRGNFVISKITLEHLGEIFKILNNYIITKNNLSIFKYIIILSLTYYHVEEKSQNQIYLFTYIKGNDAYNNPKLWEEYLQELIEHDLNGVGSNDLY